MNHDADYCPTCGQPRERAAASERMGLRVMPNLTLVFGDKSIHLSPKEAEFLRIIFERGTASHEFMLLRFASEADDQITRVYAHRVRKKLTQLTNAAITLRNVWGWGYELVGPALAVAA